jgi:hypothetical protein
MGDGRTLLAKESETDPAYDLLVVDAFSNDSIPMHLLTTQAMELYSRRVGYRGVVAMHVTNRYLDLAPVIFAAAEQKRLQPLLVTNFVETTPSKPRWPGKQMAVAKVRWIIAFHERVRELPSWEQAVSHADRETPAWTDDFGSLLHAIR